MHVHDVAYPVELARLVKQGLLKVLLVDVTASDSQRHQHLTGALHRTSVGGGGGGETQAVTQGLGRGTDIILLAIRKVQWPCEVHTAPL